MSRRSASSTSRSRLSATLRHQPAQQVDAVVVRHLLDELGHVLAAGPLDHLHLPVDREVLEDGGLVADVGVLEETPDLLDGEIVDSASATVAGCSVSQNVLHLGGVVFLQHLLDFGLNSGWAIGDILLAACGVAAIAIRHATLASGDEIIEFRSTDYRSAASLPKQTARAIRTLPCKRVERLQRLDIDDRRIIEAAPGVASIVARPARSSSSRLPFAGLDLLASLAASAR